jgi:hypothetical protein
MALPFITIVYEIRDCLGVSNNEYIACDLVEKMSKSSGWTEMSRLFFASRVGVSERGLLKILDRMEQLKLIERHPSDFKFKPCESWMNKVHSEGEQNSRDMVNKVHATGELCSPKEVNKVHSEGEQSSLHILNIKGNIKNEIKRESEIHAHENSKHQKTEFQDSDSLFNFLKHEVFSDETRMNGAKNAYEISKMIFSDEKLETLLYDFSLHPFKSKAESLVIRFSISELYAQVLGWIRRQPQFERGNQVSNNQKIYNNGNNGNSSPNKRGVKYTERINELIETVGAAQGHDETGSRFSIFDDDTEPETT